MCGLHAWLYPQSWFIAAVSSFIARRWVRPRGYKTFFMLDSTENEISTAHKKLKFQQIKKCLALSLPDVVFIMLINVKMPKIVGKTANNCWYFNINEQEKFRAQLS